MKNILILLSLFIAFNLYADKKFVYTPGADPVYLDKNAVKLSELLSPPPKRGDEVDLKDYEVILNFQKTRTKADCDRGAAVVHVDIKTFFGKPYGPLSDEEILSVPEVFRQISLDTDYFVQMIKKDTDRLRPYYADKRVKPCVHKEVTKAYPSGHTAISRVLAKMLAFRFPKKADDLMKRADQIGNDRVIVGVHHPSDIKAGQMLADKLFELFLKNDKLMMQVKQ